MSLISGIFVAAIYFFIVARNFPFEQRVISTLGHSGFCTALSFIAMNLMRYFFDQFEDIKMRYASALLFPGIILLSLIAAFHYIINTPDIIGTVAFSALTGLPAFLLFPYKFVLDLKKES